MINSFGLRILPVACAGHASWQRPHSVHENPSSTSFVVRSKIVATPKRSSSSGTSKRSGSSRPRPRSRVRANHTFTAAVAMWRCFECGRYARKPEHEAQVRPDEHPLRGTARREHLRQRVGEERPAGGPLVESGCDRARVPEEQRKDDARDQPEDHVRLADVRALEALRPNDGAVHDRGDDADEHEQDEHVDEEREPALRREPRNALVLVDRGDHRHHDRREEHEEAPEDERVHQARHEPLQELALAEHDRRLVPHAPLHVVAAGRSGLPARTSRVRKSARRPNSHPLTPSSAASATAPAIALYCPRTLLSSALIAGTISCRSPTTA